jgi:hypothetical protein
LKVFAQDPQHTALMMVISSAIENVTGTNNGSSLVLLFRRAGAD